MPNRASCPAAECCQVKSNVESARGPLLPCLPASPAAWGAATRRVHGSGWGAAPTQSSPDSCPQQCWQPREAHPHAQYRTAAVRRDRESVAGRPWLLRRQRRQAAAAAGAKYAAPLLQLTCCAELMPGAPGRPCMSPLRSARPEECNHRSPSACQACGYVCGRCDRAWSSIAQLRLYLKALLPLPAVHVALGFTCLASHHPLYTMNTC